MLQGKSNIYQILGIVILLVVIFLILIVSGVLKLS